MKNFSNPFLTLRTNLYLRKLRKLIKMMCKEFNCTFYSPEQIPNGLDSIIGMDNEKELLKDALTFFEDLKDPENVRPISPTSRFLLYGEPGSGKSKLVSGLAKTAGVPLFTVPGQLFGALGNQEALKRVLDIIFLIANTFSSGIVLDFDDLDISCKDANSEQVAIHIAHRLKQNTRAVVFISSSSPFVEYSKVLFGDNLFSINKEIVIMPPTFEVREKLFESYIKNFKLNVDDSVSPNRLAKQTYGLFPKDLEYLVRETALYVQRHGRTLITYRDFDETLLSMETGQLYSKMTDKERISTAFHEVGHALAGYYSNPDYILGRIEITPRATSLGLTKEEIGEEKQNLLYCECKSRIVYALGGMAAEKVIFKETSTGVSSDLASANSIANAMICKLGMSKSLGPVIYDPEFGVCSEYFSELFEKEMQTLLNEMYELTQRILTDHIEVLKKLADAVLEKEVLMGEEIRDIILKVEPAAESYRKNYI